MARKLLVVLILVVIVAALFLVARPFLVTNMSTLFASADTYGSSQNPSTAYGSSTSLTLDNFRVGVSSFVNRTAILFDFSSLPNPIEDVQSATLWAVLSSCRIVLIGAEGTSTDIYVLYFTGGPVFDEATATYDSLNANAATIISTVSMPATCPAVGSPVSVDVTTTVRGWVLGTIPNRGFFLYGVFQSVLATGNEIRYNFRSRELGTPKLDIIYTSPSAGQGTGVGPGTNQTQNQTGTPTPPSPPASPLIPFAAAAFVFLLIAVPLRKHPILAVVLSVAASVLVFFIVRSLLGGG